MAKTKEISFTCEEITSKPDGYRKMKLIVDSPDIDELLTEIDDEDLIGHLQGNFNPEDVFTEKDLKKWAEENGYLKIQ